MRWLFYVINFQEIILEAQPAIRAVQFILINFLKLALSNYTQIQSLYPQVF